MRKLIQLNPEVRDLEWGLADLLPEATESLYPTIWWVARDNCAVDGTDRNSCHLVRMQVSFRERLIDAPLVSAEPSAPLQHQCDAFKRWTTAFREFLFRTRWIHQVLHRSSRMIETLLPCMRLLAFNPTNHPCLGGSIRSGTLISSRAFPRIPTMREEQFERRSR